MALDNGAGGGGAIMLQEVLKNLADRAFQQQSLQQAAARTAIDQQNADTNEKYRMMAAQEAISKNAASQEEAKARQADQDAAAGLRMWNATPGGTNVATSPQAMRLMTAAGVPLQHIDPTLGSRNFTGTDASATTPTSAPRILGLASTPNPGQGVQELTPKPYGQLAAEQAQQAKVDAAREAAANRASDIQTQAANRENDIRIAASLRPQPQGPQPQMFVGPDGKPRAVQFSGGTAHEIPLPDDITSKTATKENKLSPAQQTEVENYNALLREGQRLVDNLKKTGLDKENNPITSYSRGVIAQKLGVTADDPQVDQLLQNTGYIQALALRSATGNQRMTQNLQKVFQQHIPDPYAPGKRVAMLTNELIREFGDRRKDVYGLAGVKDPNETNSTGPADTGPKPRYFNLQGQEIIK